MNLFGMNKTSMIKFGFESGLKKLPKIRNNQTCNFIIAHQNRLFNQLSSLIEVIRQVPDSSFIVDHRTHIADILEKTDQQVNDCMAQVKAMRLNQQLIKKDCQFFRDR
jgi:hypothetical protein